MKLKIIGLICAVLISSCSISNPSEGKKIGRIVKLADEGLICKTCEGELLRGGLIDGSGSMGNSFLFTLEDNMLRSLANQALEDQSEVIVYYRTKLFTWPTESETPGNAHLVYRIDRK